MSVRGSVEEVRNLREVVRERGAVRRVWDSEFHWTVGDFSSLPTTPNSTCTSRDFDFCGRRFYLLLSHNRQEWQQSEGYVSLILVLRDVDPAVTVRCSLGVRTSRGETESWGTQTQFFAPRNYLFGSNEMLRSELLRRKDLLLPGGVLTLAVTLRLEEAVASGTGVRDASVQAAVERSSADASVQVPVQDDAEGGREDEASEKTGGEKLLEDIGSLWPSGENADVLLTVGDVQFKAHKTILLARTPALGAMFQHGTAEAASGEARIEDCRPEVFEQLLHFVYKGAPGDQTAANACALFVLADKYLVTELKRSCVRCMGDGVCLDTFCDTLKVSLMYGEEGLLKRATDFFSRNMVDVMKSVQWQRFMREHMTWANEVHIRGIEMIQARWEEEKRALVDQSSVRINSAKR